VEREYRRTKYRNNTKIPYSHSENKSSTSSSSKSSPTSENRYITPEHLRNPLTDVDENSPIREQISEIEGIFLEILTKFVGEDKANQFLEGIRSDPNSWLALLEEIQPLIHQFVPYQVILNIGIILKRLAELYLTAPESNDVEDDLDLTPESIESLIAQREAYYNLNLVLPLAVTATNIDTQRLYPDSEDFSFDGLEDLIRYDRSNLARGRQRISSLYETVKDKVAQLKQVNKLSQRKIDSNVIRNAVLIRDYTEARDAVGGDERQREKISIFWQKLTADPNNADKIALISQKAENLLKTIPNLDALPIEEQEKILITLRNGILFQYYGDVLDNKKDSLADSQKSPRETEAEVDAARLHQLIKERPTQSIYEILNQSTEKVRYLAEVYNLQYGDLVADLKSLFKLSNNSNIFTDSPWRVVLGMLTRAEINVSGELVEYQKYFKDNSSEFRINSTDPETITPENLVSYTVEVPQRLKEDLAGGGYKFSWYAINSNPDSQTPIYIQGPTSSSWESVKFPGVGEYKVIVQVQYYPNGRINPPEQLVNYIEFQQKVENPTLTPKKGAPESLKAEIAQTREKLLARIPSITNRLRKAIATLEKKGLPSAAEREMFSAWDRLSQTIISLSPAVSAGVVTKEQLIQLQKEADSVLESMEDLAGHKLIMKAAALSQLGIIPSGDWSAIYQKYFELAMELDSRAISLPLNLDPKYRTSQNQDSYTALKTENERFRFTVDVHKKLADFQDRSAGKNPRKVTAYFYPNQNINDTGSTVSVVPLTLYYWSDSINWYLSQINPEQILTVSVPKRDSSSEFPPTELFEKLNSNNRFPTGVIRYLDPTGEQSQIEVTGNWGLSDWLGLVGLGALVIGVGLLTKSPSVTSKVAVWGYRAIYLSTTAGVLASAANLAETTSDGSATPISISLDLLGIVSGSAAIASQGSIVINRALSAQKGAAAAQLARFGGGTFIGLKAAETGSDAASLVLFAGDSLQQLKAVQSGPGSKEDKNKATNLLILQLIANGSLMTLGIKGNLSEMSTVNLGVKNGAVVVSSSEIDSNLITLPSTSVEPAKTVPETNQTNRNVETELDLNQNTTVNKTLPDKNNLTPTPRELIETLPKDLQVEIPISLDPTLNDNTVKVHYKEKNGLIGEIEIVAGKKATANDIKLHTRTVRIMQSYAGLLGRARRLYRDILSWFDIPSPPGPGTLGFEARLEVEKLPRIIQDRLNTIEKLQNSGADLSALDALEKEIKDFSAQLKTYEETVAQMNKNPGVGFVAAEGKKTRLEKVAKLREEFGQKPFTRTEIRNLLFDENITKKQDSSLTVRISGWANKFRNETGLYHNQYLDVYAFDEKILPVNMVKEQFGQRIFTRKEFQEFFNGKLLEFASKNPELAKQTFEQKRADYILKTWVKDSSIGLYSHQEGKRTKVRYSFDETAFARAGLTTPKQTKPSIAQEIFDNNITEQQVWQRLIKNHKDGTKNSTRKWADVLMREKLVNSEQEIIDYIKTENYQGRAVGEVRRDFKDHYRPKLLKLIYSQPSPELRYKKMREIAESLDIQGQGYFSEDWYQKEFTPRIDSETKKEIPNTTQITLDAEIVKNQYDIELSNKERRRFDELYGDENEATIREHKHVLTSFQSDQIKQFHDNIKIVQHNRNIDAKFKKGEKLDKTPKDTPVIIEEDGKKFRPKKIVYTFATPEGVKANAKFMAAQLTEPNNINILSFEIINNKGQKKTINFNNISELDEPALSQWLYH